MTFFRLDDTPKERWEVILVFVDRGQCHLNDRITVRLAAMVTEMYYPPSQ